MQELGASIEPGTSLGRFEVVAPLGSGGMGEVYRARDTRLGREVAIKVLPSRLATDLRSRARLQREATLLASLNHPNIATIHGLEESSEIEYLVLELIDGRTLSSLISEEGLEIGDSLRIARDIADALAVAHEAGVVHRDLKPSNVMLTRRGQVKVLDFGLAKRVSLAAEGPAGAPDAIVDLTRQGVLQGTPEYMSPERLEDQEPDERADIWAFGCLVFEMVTGMKAFQGRTPLATLAAVMTAEPDWDALPPALPEGLRSLLARCLEKDPTRRLEDISAAVSSLDQALAGTDPGRAAGLPARAAAPTTPSIAVLPFANLSGQPESEYFAHGLADELIHELGRVKGLRVAARTSSFRVGGGRYDVREIGRRLGVDAVLDGGVRISGDRIRITAQLVNPSDGFQLWSQRFDRASSDLFEIQEEIAGAIVDKLEVELTETGETPVVRGYKESLEAQTLFMKGRYFWDKRHEVGLTRSMKLFGEAIAADPEHPGAHVGLADAYWSLGVYAIRPPREVFPKAEAAALRALELDEGHPGAHMALAMVRFVFDWDWEAAEREFRRSIRLNPHASLPHGYYAALLALLGRTEEALREAELCGSLDPFSASAHGLAALAIGLTGRHERALVICRQGLEVEPESYGDRWVLAWLHDRSGRPEEAAALLEDLTERFGRRGILLGMLGHALAAAGREEAARGVLGELGEAASAGFVSPAFIGWVHQALGETAEAAEWMERAYEQRSNPVLFADYEGFGEYLERMGLAP